jgi:hypothetical protein
MRGSSAAIASSIVVIKTLLHASVVVTC